MHKPLILGPEDGADVKQPAYPLVSPCTIGQYLQGEGWAPVYGSCRFPII